LAPYSPILFGVNKEAVSELKLCLADSKNDIFRQKEASVSHFNISKNQFKNENASSVKRSL